MANIHTPQFHSELRAESLRAYRCNVCGFICHDFDLYNAEQQHTTSLLDTPVEWKPADFNTGRGEADETIISA